MREDLALFLYLLLIFLLSLLLGPNYILAVIKLGKIRNKQSDELLNNASGTWEQP